MDKSQHKLIIQAISWLKGWNLLEYADAVSNLLTEYELLKLENENKREGE